MLSDELQIYKDTFKLCKILMSYSKNVSRLVRYGEYSVAIAARPPWSISSKGLKSGTI